MKSQVKGGLLNDPSSFRSLNAMKSVGLVPYYQPLPIIKEEDKKICPGTLKNGNNHPVTLAYDGQALILAPRERGRINNFYKLGGLCSGVIFIPDFNN